MNNVIAIRKYNESSILRALLKLSAKKPGHPDFQDKSIITIWCSKILKYQDDLIVDAFNQANLLEYFPKNVDHFISLIDDEVKKKIEEKYRVAHEEAKRQAERIFQFAISTHHIESSKHVYEKYNLNKVSQYWVENNYKNIDEVREDFHVMKSRPFRKRDMTNEIIEYHERMQDDEKFKNEVLKGKKVEFDLKILDEKISTCDDKRNEIMLKKIKSHAEKDPSIFFSYGIEWKNGQAFGIISKFNQASHCLETIETIDFKEEKSENILDPMIADSLSRIKNIIENRRLS